MQEGDNIVISIRRKIRKSRFYYTLTNDDKRSKTSFEKCFVNRFSKFLSIEKNDFKIEKVECVKNRKMMVEFVMLKQNFDFINRALIFNRKKFYVKQI